MPDTIADGVNENAASSGAISNLGRLLAPRAIAVIGASDKPENLGKAVFDNLLKFGFPGDVWPIHPSAASVSGQRAYASVADTPTVPDMVVLAVGAASLADAVRQSAAAGAVSGIALAGGFAELGEDGRARQADLARACESAKFALCGPNCIGIINTSLPMAATFASSLLSSATLLTGNISIVSQSGGIATFAQSLAGQAGVGLRHVVSSGNEAVLGVADFIAEFARDEGTKVICAYIEGIRNPERLLTALALARARRKPLVLLKAGTTPESALAALAHTGALAGSDRVWNAVLREHAAIRVYSLEELLDTALFLSGHPLQSLPRGRRVAIVGFGGGGGVLGADQAAANGLQLAQLSSERRDRVQALVPPIASIANPFDLTPDSYNKSEYLQRFPKALREIVNDPAVDAILFQLGAIAHKAPVIMDAIVGLRESCDKTIAVAWPVAPTSVTERLPREGFHVFSDAARAMQVLGRVAQHRVDLDRTISEQSEALEAAWPTFSAPGVLGEHACTPLLANLGLPMARGLFVPTRDNLIAACDDVGYPVALKGISASITHRAAHGLVALDVANDEQVASIAAAFAQRASRSAATLDGIYVQAMSARGVELIVGAFRDPIFGVVVSCGAGGNFTELLDDVAFARAPITVGTARQLMSSLRIAQYHIRKSGLDIAGPAEFVAHFSRIAVGVPWSEFALEINPIIWHDDGVVGVDSLAVIATP